MVGVKFFICYKFGVEGTAHILQLISQWILDGM